MVPLHWSAMWAAFSASLLEIWVRLLGGYSSDGHWHTFPLLQLLAIGGLALLGRYAAVGRRLALVSVVWCVLGTTSSATLQTALWHHYRYQMPYYPLLLLLGSLGYVHLASRWLQSTRVRWLVALAPVALWGLYSAQAFRVEYLRDTRTAAGMQLALADWLQANTPAGARVAVHDPGITRYYGSRVTVDVVGLTTTAMAEAYRHGPGSLYEALERLQPDYYAVYPNRAPPYFGVGAAPTLLGQELFRVQLPDYSSVTSAGDTQVITQPDWSQAVLADVPRQPSTQAQVAGLTLVDALDIADLSDEQRHGYTWWNVGEPAGFPTDVGVLTYRQDPSLTLADGGRQLTGGESFVLAVQPETALVLVVRLHQTADMILAVTINGADLGEWRLPAIPGQWLESAFTVDPQYLPGASATVVLSIKEAPADARYGPFHYWAYQGVVAPQPAIAPQRAFTATFGTVATLVGVDEPGAAVSPGQVLELTLYWRSLEPDRANYRVFVHLMDAVDDSAAGILAQADEAPLAGTNPFWIWPMGQTVSQTVQLGVPAQAPPGKYWLLAGIYNADTGDRLPISGAPDFGSARLVLGEVTIP